MFKSHSDETKINIWRKCFKSIFETWNVFAAKLLIVSPCRQRTLTRQVLNIQLLLGQYKPNKLEIKQIEFRALNGNSLLFSRYLLLDRIVNKSFWANMVQRKRKKNENVTLNVYRFGHSSRLASPVGPLSTARRWPSLYCSTNFSFAASNNRGTSEQHWR